MSLLISHVKGMKDILPEETSLWRFLEEHLSALAHAYGYQEIRLPLVEKTALFARSIGDNTDIVEKEMYTFEDKGGEWLSLRPEGTAQVVRALLENQLMREPWHRVWYLGPMFRRERPQKGRYRQFYQFGLEAYGLPGVDVECEQLCLIARLWQRLGLSDAIRLEINCLGIAEERARYREQLMRYFKQHEASLDEESRRRLPQNPLRLLDSKHPGMRDIIKGAPSFLESLGDTSLAHWEALQKALHRQQISFVVNARLVRGLDYYTHTVYEWVTEALGAQGTVCAGGRYNDLVAQMGGETLPAVGCALGLERLILLLQANAVEQKRSLVDVYLIVGENCWPEALRIAERIRESLPALRLLMHCGGGGFKSQFKRADRSGARWALIVGEEERKREEVSLKALRETESMQKSLSVEEMIRYLNTQCS